LTRGTDDKIIDYQHQQHHFQLYTDVFGSSPLMVVKEGTTSLVHRYEEPEEIPAIYLLHQV
jgi:hypothetical protein